MDASQSCWSRGPARVLFPLIGSLFKAWSWSPEVSDVDAARWWLSYWVMVGMLRDLFMMRRTSTSGRLSCLVWAHPSSAAAMCRSKRSDTDFLRSLGFPLKKEPSHCFITLSIFSVLQYDEWQDDEQCCWFFFNVRVFIFMLCIFWSKNLHSMICTVWLFFFIPNISITIIFSVITCFKQPLNLFKSGPDPMELWDTMILLLVSHS